ncbi:MAG: hypothetical protein IJ523_10465 [Succinivibrionaceae bacterium]|nr:hypothetical protein [Succinivibrionaceae bacterium]
MEALIKNAGYILVLMGCLLVAVLFAYWAVLLIGKLVNEWHDAKLQYNAERVCDDIYKRIHKLESDLYNLKCSHLEDHK